MPQFTLEQIHEAADQRFGPFVIPDVPGGAVTLLNPVRLPKDKRQQLVQLQQSANAIDDVDAALTALQDIILLVAQTKDQGRRLLKAIGDDQAHLAVLLQEYGKVAQGEASPSPS